MKYLHQLHIQLAHRRCDEGTFQAVYNDGDISFMDFYATGNFDCVNDGADKDVESIIKFLPAVTLGMSVFPRLI
jgi:hypothetical protein